MPSSAWKKKRLKSRHLVISSVVFIFFPSFSVFFFFFFFNDTATTEIYTLSLHDALPISLRSVSAARSACACDTSRCVQARIFCGPAACTRTPFCFRRAATSLADRKSTRLNSSHLVISYAVFCLEKKTSEIPSPCNLVCRLYFFSFFLCFFFFFFF